MKKGDVDLSTVIGRDRRCPPIRLTPAVYNASGQAARASRRRWRRSRRRDRGRARQERDARASEGTTCRGRGTTMTAAEDREEEEEEASRVSTRRACPTTASGYISPQTIRGNHGRVRSVLLKERGSKPYMISISGKTLAA
ncbi:hypothetical protein ACHAW5_001903 [Stephanodiscus triporus]|uniref:Uncharacterized protein n=1 Tax=Stephanodiscus triporus TaxID=2934178 RepID=A0ABD3PGJ4_9STRA